MKALTLIRPMDWAIIHGGKDVVCLKWRNLDADTSENVLKAAVEFHLLFHERMTVASIDVMGGFTGIRTFMVSKGNRQIEVQVELLVLGGQEKVQEILAHLKPHLDRISSEHGGIELRSDAASGEGTAEDLN